MDRDEYLKRITQIIMARFYQVWPAQKCIDILMSGDAEQIKAYQNCKAKCQSRIESCMKEFDDAGEDYMKVVGAFKTYDEDCV